MLKRVLASAALLILVRAQGAETPAERDLGDIANSPATVRAVGFGDWGYHGTGSGFREVSATIAKIHAAVPFTLGFTLGDNFYIGGVRNTKDRAWHTFWEAGYAGLGIPFFATLGNHDYQGNPQAEVDYTKVSPSQTWKMPYRYYTYAAGPVRFFALDTDENFPAGSLHAKPWSKLQSGWLDSGLSKYESSPWKIVYGHHPVFNDGGEGDDKRMTQQLLPLLKRHKVDAYLCGHDHNLQHFSNDGIEFFLVGGGGKDTEPVKARRADYAASRHGFLVVDADGKRISFHLYSAAGAILFKRELTK